MLDAIFISFISVTLPLLIGGIFSLLLKRKNENWILSLIYVSIGSLIVLVLFHMFPSLVETAKTVNEFGIIYLILFLIVFLVLIFSVHFLLDKFIYKHKHHHDCHHEHDHGHIDVYLEKRKESFKKAGIALAIALFFHNFPEGMALGIEVKDELTHALNLTTSLLFHNLVMGITMSLPLLLSGMKRRNVLFLLIVSSLPSIVGTIIGYALSGGNEIVNFVLLTFSCSVLIFVIYEEFKSIIHKKFKWYYILALIIGITISYLITLLHIAH